MCRGRGEIVSELPAPSSLWFVIVVPEMVIPPGKTGSMYSRVTPGDYSSGSKTEELVKTLETGRAVEEGHIFNAFERIAFDVFPELNGCRRDMLAAGASSVHLAGAGPALFSIHSSLQKAMEVKKKLGAARSFVAAAAARPEDCGCTL